MPWTEPVGFVDHRPNMWITQTGEIGSWTLPVVVPA